MNWLRRIMVGRYGLDQLGYALIGAGLICSLVRNFAGRSFFGTVLSMLAMLLLALCYFRLFSRNYEKRHRENEIFMVWCRPISAYFSGFKGNFAEWQGYKHFKCPQCGKKIRIPRGRGKIAVTCPGCHEQFVKKT